MDRNNFQLLVKISRPRFWAYLAGPWLVGTAYATPNYHLTLSNYQFWIGMLIFLLPANMVLYGINDLADWDTDRGNVKKGTKEHLLQEKERNLVKVGVGVALCVLLAFGLFLRPILALNIIFIILCVSYSVNPYRFKARPILDMLSNVLYVLPGVMGYFLATGNWPPMQIVVAASAWVMAMQLYSAIPDIEPDRQANLMTTATVLGEKSSSILSGLLWLISALLVYLLDPMLGILGGVYLLVILLNLVKKVPVAKSYWWFPKINFLVGFILVARHWL